jgi:hypothetical protein
MSDNVAIYKAEVEGYVVITDPGFGEDEVISFAGSLSDCLDFVAGYFEPADEDDSDDLGLE